MSDPYELLLGERKTVTEKDIDFFAENPDRIDLLNTRETGKDKRLVALLLGAVALIVLSKLIVARYPDLLVQLVSDVFVDLFFELGAALIGAAVTVLLINRSSLRQMHENLELRREIERRIAERQAR